jgi:hypothetical protein
MIIFDEINKYFITNIPSFLHSLILTLIQLMHRSSHMKPRDLELLITYKHTNNCCNIHEKNTEYVKYEAKQ